MFGRSTAVELCWKWFQWHIFFLNFIMCLSLYWAELIKNVTGKSQKSRQRNSETYFSKKKSFCFVHMLQCCVCISAFHHMHIIFDSTNVRTQKVLKKYRKLTRNFVNCSSVSVYGKYKLCQVQKLRYLYHLMLQ